MKVRKWKSPGETGRVGRSAKAIRDNSPLHNASRGKRSLDLLRSVIEKT